ncbi:hypothetical protein FVER53590_07611 [Fusarium verticillioides]|nr:hypothetical protein FVER53590_07611 [Fusarium verticillioides]
MKWIVPFLVAFVPLVAAQNATKELLTNLPACAAPCYEDAIKKSDCNSTDVKCVCSTQVIIQTAEACAAQACHVRDSLTTLNMTYTYCEVPVRNKTPIFINVTIVLGVISGVATALRLWSKFFYTKTELGLDDLFIVLTLFIGMPSTAMNIHGTAGHGEGRDIWTLEFDDITKFGFYFWLLEIFYFAQVSLLKTSLLFFYLRIFPGNAQKLLWGTIIFNSVFGVLFMFLAAFQCTPVSYFWLNWDGEHKGTCMNSTAIGWANASISVAVDVWMLAVPMWYLRKLKLHWKKKIGVAAMFIVGTFVTVVSIIRLQFLVDLGSSHNPTYDQTDISIWSTVEINVGIICASMPALRVILVRLFPSLGGSSYDSSKYNNYGEHYGRKSHIMSRSRARIQDDVPGLYASPILLRGSEADKSAQLSQINAIKDLAKLDGILENIKRQRQLHIKAVSPLIVAWTAFCITWPYATSQGDLSVLFKIGAVSGAFIIAAQLVRKFLQLRKITPLQHKVRGLVRAFKNGTIRYRDPEEVMISSLNKL